MQHQFLSKNLKCVQFLLLNALNITMIYTWLGKNKENAVRRVLGDVWNDILEDFQIML